MTWLMFSHGPCLAARRLTHLCGIWSKVFLNVCNDSSHDVKAHMCLDSLPSFPHAMIDNTINKDSTELVRTYFIVLVLCSYSPEVLFAPLFFVFLNNVWLNKIWPTTYFLFFFFSVWGLVFMDYLILKFKQVGIQLIYCSWFNVVFLHYFDYFALNHVA